MMTYLKQIALAAAALLTALMAGPALAQATPDIVGEWHGAISTPQADITLGIYVARSADGKLSAQFENYDQNPGRRVEITELGVTGARLSWKVASMGAAFEGDWDATARAWKGKFHQAGDLPFNLVKGAPPHHPVVSGLDGVWVGVVDRNGTKIRQVFNIRTIEQGTFVLYSSPEQLVNSLPVTDLTRDNREVTLSVVRGAAKFAGILSEDGTLLSGTWTATGQPNVTLTLAKSTAQAIAAQRNPTRPQTPKPPFPYKSVEATFDNPAFADVHLAGTLTLPEGPGPFPAAVMITGSGGQDRDDTMLDHKFFAVIADHLTRNGIAVLRVDDRGVGKSTGNYDAATSADLATDANAAFEYLTTRSEIRRDAIGFIGHSEGGMIGPIAMASNDRVAYFVSLAGPGTDLIQLLLSQRRLLATQMGLPQATIDRQEPVMRALFMAMTRAKTPQAAYDAAMAVMTPEAKQIMGMPADMDAAVLVRQISGPWYQYFMKYDPAPNLSRIKVPVLALAGTLDLQVPAKENLPAIRAALKNNPDVTIVELPGLNHLFQPAKTGGVSEYRDIETTVAPVVLDTITTWIRQRFVKR